MPVLDAANLALMRTRPISRDWTLYIYQPLELWRGTVGGAPSQGDRALTVATVSGDVTDLVAGMTIRVTDAAGNLKTPPASRVRFKSYGAPVMTVAENAIDWTVGDILYGMRLFELWPRIPFVNPTTAVQFKDRDIAWTTDAAAQLPKANSGPDAVALLTGATVDIVFKDEGSFDCPGGNAVVSHLWAALPAVGSGDPGAPTVSAGGEATATVTYRWPDAGYFYVSHTVTDGNGETGVVYTKVIIDDGTLPTSRVVPGSRGWDGSGWALSRDVITLDGVDSTWYDGAPVLVVADTYAVPTQAYVDNRSNLRWSGWLTEDSTDRDAYDRDVSFRAVSTVHLMRNIPAYPVRMNSEAVPTDWYGFTDLSIDSVVYLLGLWHSTLMWIADYHPTLEDEWVGGAGARARPGENCKGNRLLGQMDDVMAAAQGNIRCDRQGIVRAMRNEWFLTVAEQAARVTVLTLLDSDFMSIRYGPHPHKAKVREVRASGVDGASNPYLVGAPGSSPLDGGQPQEETRLAPKSAAELQRWAGQQLAIENWGVQAALDMSGEYDVVDPALGELIAGALNTYDSRVPDGPYSIWSVSFDDDHDRGLTLGAWTLLPAPGVYPAEDRDIPVVPDPPATPPIPTEGYPELPEPELDWPSTIYVGTRTLGVYYSGTFTGPDTGLQPTWTAVNSGLGATDVRQLGIDYFDREVRQFCLLEAARDLYRREDSGTWATILTNAEARTALGLAVGQIMYFSPDRGIDGTMFVFFAVAAGADEGLYYFKTTDYTEGTASWSSAKIRPMNLNFNNVGNIIAIDGNVYIAYNDNGAPGKRTYVDSSRGGIGWAQSPNLGISAWLPWAHCDPFNAGFAYANGNGVGGPDLVKVQDSAALVVLQNALNIGPQRPDTMWFSDLTSGLQRILLSSAIYESTDSWTSVVDSTPATVDPGAVSFSEFVSEDDDMILFGAFPPGGGVRPHHIMAMEESDSVTPVGKAGTNAGTAPYVDAIPETAGGISYEGIQVVG